MVEFILRRRGRVVTVVVALIVLAATTAATMALRDSSSSGRWAQSAPPPPTGAAAAPEPSPQVESPPAAAPAPAGLKVIDYDPAPVGFPADPAPLSAELLTEGLHTNSNEVAYDAPGGRPIAYLPPDIRGVRLTVPIVERHSGWVAVMVPSVNRRIAWLPAGDWTVEPLRDQLVVERATHTLYWMRDGREYRSWPVTLGVRATPTPLGRTFIIGRSTPSEKVYAGTDVFALGAVPDDVSALPKGLRGAHIGIHTWHHDRSLGKDTSDGCIRLTKKGHQELLATVPSGTEVLVVDRR